MALAISSLPVPDSPRMSTVLFHLATRRTWSNTRRMEAVWPTTMFSKPYLARTSRRSSSRSSATSWPSAMFTTRRTVCASSRATISIRRVRSGISSSARRSGWAASTPMVVPSTALIGTAMKGRSMSYSASRSRKRGSASMRPSTTLLPCLRMLPNTPSPMR